MAIDSRNKRASAICLAGPWRVLLPNPFGTIDAPARLQIGWCYKGIAAAVPVALGEVYGLHRYLVPGHRRAFTVPAHDRTFVVPNRKRTS
jgi:hypothetical protein